MVLARMWREKRERAAQERQYQAMIIEKAKRIEEFMTIMSPLHQGIHSDPVPSATLPSATAFADLIAGNNLVVVWHFDNTTKGWAFYDPRPEVAEVCDLEEVTIGFNVWIEVRADQEFQGQTLTAGWNSITLK